MRRSRAASGVLIEDLIDGANHVGLILVDSEGLIAELSVYARKLLQRGRGVRDRGGRLTAERREDAEALERLLADAASTGNAGESVALGTQDGRRLVVHAKPVVNGSAQVPATRTGHGSRRASFWSIRGASSPLIQRP